MQCWSNLIEPSHDTDNRIFAYKKLFFMWRNYEKKMEVLQKCRTMVKIILRPEFNVKYEFEV